MRLHGKRALVTAAGQGIGRAIAGAFIEAGAIVYALDRDARLIQNLDNPITLDLMDGAAIDGLPARTGPVDILINAAGIVHAGTILDCATEEWDAAFALNVTAMYRSMRAYLPGMIAQKSGSIVNVASVASSIIGVRNRFAYGASKAAVIGMTKAVAADHVRDGVRCNAICPGTVESPSLLQRMEEQSARTGDTFDDTYRAFADRQPMGRLGKPAEIASMALHLASDESAFTTGMVAVVDGGWTVE
ncbi:NAD(P)-dependent oxidoreductase [Sphingobium lactosutens]|uniref:SDR family oxidoreductase n=1 Tax=Sphingobium lactosutens TaxID=522773 RepID=UPI0015BF7CE1|nr:SDR family oxidoreductase [Sphingobium lactosutens]NWK97674.1 NAD(P)-dependent oxidoreductase [Sphingobium lactosutens]